LLNERDSLPQNRAAVNRSRTIGGQPESGRNEAEILKPNSKRIRTSFMEELLD
jgi:hypothetical protein